MFDIGWQEIFIVGILALIIVGPKDLPRALKTGTLYLRKARGMAREFQNGLNEVIREAELDDLKQQVAEGKDFDINKAIEKHVDGADLDEELELSDGAAGLELEEDYQKRKEEAEEKARRQLEGEDQRVDAENSGTGEVEDHELDGYDEDDDEPEENAPEDEPENAPKADA